MPRQYARELFSEGLARGRNSQDAWSSQHRCQYSSLISFPSVILGRAPYANEIDSRAGILASDWRWVSLAPCESALYPWLLELIRFVGAFQRRHEWGEGTQRYCWSIFWTIKLLRCCFLVMLTNHVYICGTTLILLHQIVVFKGGVDRCRWTICAVSVVDRVL
jgi:hypothetical protein